MTTVANLRPLAKEEHNAAVLEPGPLTACLPGSPGSVQERGAMHDIVDPEVTARAQEAAGQEAEHVCIVVGDWFVDEHWACGVHRSSSSSRTGKSHLRALHGPRTTVRSFCGAGRSAFFLHQLYRRPDSDTPAKSVIGLGFWHRADTGALVSLFEPDAPAETPYRLTSPSLARPVGIELVNMNDALNMREAASREDDHARIRDAKEYTTRIIRIYTRGEGDRVVYDRLDWEPQTPRGDSLSEGVEWPDPKLKELSRLLTRQIDGRKVDAVIIKDLRKGVVNKTIVNWLISQSFPEAQWFVSSKEWRPDWAANLGGRVDLRLFMTPQVPAQAVVKSKEGRLSRWIMRSGKPSKRATDLVNELAEYTGARRIMVLPDGFSALAFDSLTRERDNCVVQSQTRPEKVTVDMGLASIVFPALVALMSSEKTKDVGLKELVNVSLRTAYEWVESEAERVSNPRGWKPSPDAWAGNVLFTEYLRPLLHGRAADQTLNTFGNTTFLSWKDEGLEWAEAFREVGIIGRDNGRSGRFEPWRAMLEVDEYVCCEETKRDRLRQLLQGIESFATTPKHHASCMLVASPGAGKTFLAKRLAQSAGLRFVPFNITQMRSKADILECLDTVVAVQSENEDRRLLVFIDEINAKLEAAPVFGAFLTPLEDGTYVRGGRTFNIRPCVWVVAGTRHPVLQEPSSPAGKREPSEDKNDKGSDFVSRLTLGVVDLDSGPGDEMNTGDIEDMREKEALRALENVYLGVSTLKQEFPDVRQVSELVLRAFWVLPRMARVRDVKHFVRRFSDIQYGEVTGRSIPDRWPEDHDDKEFRKWKGWKTQGVYSDKADVQIV